MWCVSSLADISISIGGSVVTVYFTVFMLFLHRKKALQILWSGEKKINEKSENETEMKKIEENALNRDSYDKRKTAQH